MASDLNLAAKAFKGLHRPNQPVVLANVYDGISAKTVAALPASKAIATASWAIAEAAGVPDEELTLEENIRATRIIATAIKGSGKPLSVDLQDGYGDQLEDAIKQVIGAGAIGANIEDYDNANKRLYSAHDAVNRVKHALAIADALGVPDFVVNARCDALVYGGTIDEVISRGQAFLAAGATSVFVLGPLDQAHPGELTREQITKLIQAFEGRVNLVPGENTTKELAALGVARISVGPDLQMVAMKALKKEAEKFLDV
ncbi:isocitrate lyase/PEP mutase family protein [Aspergillus candidus]|uniref:Phosphoenolpyruvate phosphomutase-domain-containing protein n=1 Tax=Aspergillus candidus TaxID=41067 RepID=A0A2I2EY11_ASPCN|nr:phosphoenolpyruvate phosphomutase-domain-containing protein [Aspergillus candidus]PLB33265.1 phosphoenolpyruvate phosphomutase-domain-containing protein [Aspergillus candidus]